VACSTGPDRIGRYYDDLLYEEGARTLSRMKRPESRGRVRAGMLRCNPLRPPRRGGGAGLAGARPARRRRRRHAGRRGGASPRSTSNHRTAAVRAAAGGARRQRVSRSLSRRHGRARPQRPQSRSHRGGDRPCVRIRPPADSTLTVQRVGGGATGFLPFTCASSFALSRKMRLCATFSQTNANCAPRRIPATAAIAPQAAARKMENKAE
jgi:hypothetical protein